MTLPECENNEESVICQSTTIEVIDEITDIKQENSQSEGRLITGAYNCAKFLNSNPDDINLCLLTDSGMTEDVTLNIEHTLIEAYCYENKIPVVKGQPAMYILEKDYLPEIDDDMKVKDADLSCVLVLFSKEIKKDEHEKFEKGDFQDDVFHDVSDQPSIKFPD